MVDINELLTTNTPAEEIECIKQTRLDNGRVLCEYNNGFSFSFASMSEKEYENLYSDFFLSPKNLATLPNDADELFSQIIPDFDRANPLTTRMEIDELKKAKYMFVRYETLFLKIRLTDLQKTFFYLLGEESYVRQFIDKRLRVSLYDYGEFWLSSKTDYTFVGAAIGDGDKLRIAKAKV